jgi:hypothetical protein
LLAFTSVYFSESGLFNGLRRIQIKKLFPCHTVPQMSQAAFSLLLLAADAAGGVRSGDWNNI